MADAPNPKPDTAGTATVNGDGTVTAELHGSWVWVGQTCAGRWGEGVAVDWWGISTSQTPADPFSMTNATAVVTPGSTTTTTVSPTGYIQVKNTSPAQYFHVAKYLAGENIHSATTCTDVMINGKHSSTGPWDAHATYPSLSKIPQSVCVNVYDQHGSIGKISTNSKDFSTLNSDNSIQTNAFNPTVGAGYCVNLQVLSQIKAEIFNCDNGVATTTLASGGSLAVPAASLSSSNPLAPTNVAAGSYTVNATAPSGQEFVACGKTGVTLNGASASQTVVVPTGGVGDGKFYVQSIPPPTQTIQAEIYICDNGVATTTLASGGTLKVPAANLSSSNPLAATEVPAATYRVNATAPTGMKFTSCGKSGVTISSTGTTAYRSVVVPSGGSGNGKFYAKPITYGWIEVCKSDANGVTGNFTFTFSGMSVTVPAGACSSAVKVPTGSVKVHENAKTGFVMKSASTTPSDRLVSTDPANGNAVVKVVEGDVSTQTIVTFVNAPAKGTLKVCQVAGTGIAENTMFGFTNSATGESISVPAGPAPGGYCVSFPTKIVVGTSVVVTQTIPSGDKVTSIAVAPTSQLVGSPDLANGKVTVKIGSGVTEVTYTDAVS